MKPTERQIEAVAKIMAATYWRGRLHALIETPTGCNMTIEGMIKAAAETEWPAWASAARVAIVMGHQ